MPAIAGFNIIGHVSGNLGLGVLARQVVSVVLARGHPVQVLDIDPGLGRGGHDQRFAERTVNSVQELVNPITLLVLPPNSIADFLLDTQNRDLLLRNGALNAAFMNWEQMVVPHQWVRVLEGLDVIVAPSAFTRDTFERALPTVPALTAKVPLRLPQGVAANRQRFGLQPGRIWFGSSFEPQSDTARKNPFAVLDAFQQAHSLRLDVGLAVKVNNPTVEGKTHAVMDTLRARSRADQRIVLLEEPLDYASVLSLYASLDVYVSLHRSEGIGLGLMEAMILGRPVIATAWSGNMSFMDRSNSCLVSYELVPVRGGGHVYSEAVLGPGAVWAEPDVRNAVEWMRVLADRPDIRTTIGGNASEAMRRYQDEAHHGHFLEELFTILESEVSWGIGQHSRHLRRHRLENTVVPTRLAEATSGPTWLRKARSLARRVGFRRGRFPWCRPRRPAP